MDLQAQLRYMAQQLQACEGDLPSLSAFDLKLHYLTDVNTTCNDGSPAGYYLKESPKSKRWLVYLEGGWFCYNQMSCNIRANSQMRYLMTSKNWSKTKRGNGMLSPQPEENPNWWNANHVLIPYCSSDAWSGNASRHETGEKFSFLGARILEKVIEDLLPRGLYNAKHLLLAGSSAGGIGVILNLDRISTKLHAMGFAVEVRGLADSGWYLSDRPFESSCPPGVKECGPVKTIKEGMMYWRGIVPENCTKENLLQPWMCYFGETVYPTITAPLFIFQWLYDEAQLALDGSIQPRGIQTIDLKQIKTIFKIGRKIRESLKRARVRHVFSPACISHTILTHSSWLNIRLKGASLNDILTCWYHTDGHEDGHGKHGHGKHGHGKHGPENQHHWSTHQVDHCLYIQCNPTCPIPRNPFTGK
ncbi:predicted protein, partial [Nematostella vectensis]